MAPGILADRARTFARRATWRWRTGVNDDSALHLRVFLSSPGDVEEERRIAQAVLDEVPRQPLLRGKVFIETVAWDDPNARTPLFAHEQPQQSVNRFNFKPSECDLTVVILWSRLGTKLPPEQRKPDGSTYASGTDWELEDARSAGKDVYVYWRTQIPTFIGDPETHAKEQQYAALMKFIETFRNPDGSAAGGYNDYDSPAAFRERFTQHLEMYIRLLGDRTRASALAQHRYDFGDELQLAAALVGRDEVFTALKQFETSQRCGYFRVIAGAGLGKTTLAAAVASRHNAVSFFTNANRGLIRPEQCLNHLSVELISRYGLPYDRLPVRAGEDATFFETLLGEAVRKSSGHVWLVVDALGEADQGAGGNPLLLPRDLPDGVFCFVTQRPDDPVIETDQATPVVDHVIAADSSAHREDVVAFIEQQMARPALAQGLRAAFPRRNDGAIVNELATMSEGNFMYLSYVLRDVETGEWTPTDEAALPKGLRGYYAAMWARLKPLMELDSGREWKALYRPVLGLLAVAREPVTVEWLAEIGGGEAEDVRDAVVTRFGRFLLTEPAGKTVRYRIVHRSFADFLADKLDLPKRHAAIAQYFDEARTWETHGGYASRHLSHHLRAAHDADGLAGLVAQEEWYANQLIADPSGGAYERDLREAAAFAAVVDAEAAAKGDGVPALGLEIEAVLGMVTLSAYWLNVPVDITASLLGLGVLSDAQVLGATGRISQPSIVASVVSGIANAVSNTSLPHALDLARTIDDPSFRTEALLALVNRLSPDQRAAVLVEARTAAEHVEDQGSTKVGLLCRIGAASVGDQRQALFERARTLAIGIDRVLDRANALGQMLADVPDVLQDLRTALASAGTAQSEEPDVVGEILEEIVSDAPEAVRAEVARAALGAALAIEDPGQKAVALTSIVAALIEAERPESLGAALQAIRSLPDPAGQAQHLLELANAVGDGAASRFVAEAEECIARGGERTSRIMALMKLAARLPQPQARLRIDEALGLAGEAEEPIEGIVDFTHAAGTLSDALKDIALEGVRKRVATLRSPSAKARALIEIAQLASGHRMRQLVTEAARIPGGILAFGVLEEEGVERVEALAALAREVEEPRRAAVLEAARALAARVEGPYEAARVMAALLDFVDPSGRAGVVADLRRRTSDLERADQRAELLTALVPYCAPAERSEIVREALATARQIGPGELTPSGSINMRTGVVFIDCAPAIAGRPSRAILRLALLSTDPERGELIAESLDRMRDTHVAFQSELLTELAWLLTSAQITAVLTDFQQITTDRLRDEFARSLRQLTQVDAEPNDGDGDQPTPVDGEVNEGDGDGPEVNVVPVENIFRLSRSPDQVAFRISYDRPPSWESPAQQERYERGIIRSIAGQVLEGVPDEERQDLLVAAEKLRGVGWLLALSELFAALAATDSGDAVARARALWPERLPPVVVGSLARHLQVAERTQIVRDALEDATRASQPTERVIGLLSLLPELDPPDAASALGALTAALGEVSGESIVALLADVHDLDAVPASVRLVLVQQALRRTESRRDFFAAIPKLLPPLKSLAVPGIVDSLADIVLRSDRWTL